MTQIKLKNEDDPEKEKELKKSKGWVELWRIKKIIYNFMKKLGRKTHNFFQKKMNGRTNRRGTENYNK